MKIRAISIADAENMLRLNVRLDNESEYMLFAPGERVKALKIRDDYFDELYMAKVSA